MLDVFAYAGGFSVHALAGGAKEVTSVDISKQALEMATENALLNKFSGKHITLAGDAFEILEQMRKRRKQFDIVVIDPPSFAKSASGVEVAQKISSACPPRSVTGITRWTAGSCLMHSTRHSRPFFCRSRECYEVFRQQLHFAGKNIPRHRPPHIL